MIQITVLAENSVNAAHLLAEHGLACWVKTEDQQILFDTGQGQVLLHNAERMKINCQHAEAVVLSHGHYDHTGGLKQVLQNRRGVSIYGHPACLLPRYVRTATGAAREVGIPGDAHQCITRGAHRWQQTVGPTRIGSRLSVTGPVPRCNDYEDTGGAFYLDRDCVQADPVEDDQALFFATGSGTVVLLGCAHAGVINTLRYVKQWTNDAPLYMVLGGMHLVNAAAGRVQQTIADLRELGVQRLAPGHCTGSVAWAALRAVLWRSLRLISRRYAA